MRIHILGTGASLGLAYHLIKEGHSVNSTYSNSDITLTGTPDIHISDVTHNPTAAETLRDRGVRVLGVDSWSHLVEVDSSYNHAVTRILGFPTAYPQIKGDRVTVACLTNGNSIISKMLVFPYRRMMSCDVGTELACSGYVAAFDVAKSKLVGEMSLQLEKFLKKTSHRGMFSVDCIIDKTDVYVERVSTDMSKAYITAIFENTRVKKADVLLKLCDINSTTVQHLDPWAAGVLVSISPYPHLVPKKPEQVTGFNPMNLKHFWLVDVAQDGENWYVGANSGCLGYVTSRGASIQEASRRVYRTLSNIHVESIQYRSDIGKDIYDRYDRLREAKLV